MRQYHHIIRVPGDRDPFPDNQLEMIERYDREHAPLACAKWCKKEPHRLSIDDMKAFANWLGYPFDGANRTRVVPTFLSEVRQTLDAINGPHGDTILKMLEARKQDASD